MVGSRDFPDKIITLDIEKKRIQFIVVRFE